MSSELKILEKLFPQLCNSLNTDEVRPYLVESGAITINQCEEFQLGNPGIPTQRKLAEKTVIAISRDEHCATKLLQALEKTESAKNGESSHYELVLALREEINKSKVCLQMMSLSSSSSSAQGDAVSSDGPYYQNLMSKEKLGMLLISAHYCDNYHSL